MYDEGMPYSETDKQQKIRQSFRGKTSVVCVTVTHADNSAMLLLTTRGLPCFVFKEMLPQLRVVFNVANVTLACLPQRQEGGPLKQ